MKFFLTKLKILNERKNNISLSREKNAVSFPVIVFCLYLDAKYNDGGLLHFALLIHFALTQF